MLAQTQKLTYSFNKFKMKLNGAKSKRREKRKSQRMKHNKENSTCQTKIPRGKHHNKIAAKTTVSLYLNRNRVEKARNHNLNLSRVTENSLNNILSYIMSQNRQKSIFLGEAFGKEGSLVRSPGFEPDTRLGKPGS